MRFRLVPQIAALVLGSAAVAVAVPAAGDEKKSGAPDTSDLVEQARSLLDEPKSSHHRRHHKRSGASSDTADGEQPTGKHGKAAAHSAAAPDPVRGTQAPAPPAAATPVHANPAQAAPTQATPTAATPTAANQAAATPAAATPAAANQAAVPTAPAVPSPATPGLAAGPDGGPIVAQDGGTSVDAGADAGSPPDLLPPDVAQAATDSESSEPESTAASRPTGESPHHAAAKHRVRAFSTPEERIRSGRNYAMQGAMLSPLARLGIPVKAVPAVATAATVSATAFWPFLLKTLLGLFKGVIGGYVKNWGKKNKKIETTQRQYVIFGLQIRPRELLALFIGAVIYGLAVCYTAKGWKLDRTFVLPQETLIVAIYYFRSLIRFFYERAFNVVTQFRFWPGGSLLCLASAYLGNTLGTVGYDLESAKGPEAAERAVRLKVWLLLIALGMALGFFFANWIYPQKILQSGRIMTSGMALGEIMPIAPLPGLRIYKWRRGVWAILFTIIIPTFFLINFFL